MATVQTWQSITREDTQEMSMDHKQSMHAKDM
uniref:Uncharacterized protein n=1 Tax=Anguilla anguilla TaxID=7936 RepID=A0A0E9TQ84_ANGAN